MGDDIFKLVSTLGLTLIIEYPIVQIIWLFIKEEEKSKLVFWKNRIIIVPAIIVNVLTNPAINIFARFLWRDTSLEEGTIWTIITVLEIVIWIIEGLLYKYMLKTKWSTGFLLSFSANFVSYMSSFILF